ncbi:Separin [Podospora australis]|uniref:separase n=1 Tax=Podospora australis TaxID=1536484 RepID=A0AAN6X7R4_9PEZI|nr:Separin [Podospora australis]
MDTQLASHAETVRSAVSSVASCTPATSVLLKSLLLSSNGNHNNHASITTEEPRTASRAATSARSRANTASTTASSLSRAPSRRAKAAPVPSTTTTEQNNGLSIREKASLATQVINATLKALSEAAKPPSAPASAPQPTAEDGDLVKTATRNAIRRTSSAPMSPLQPRPLNRQSTSPVVTRHTRSPSKSSNSNTPSTNLLSLVECGRVALAALRQVVTSGKVTLPELQLESGMSTLIARLIALGLHEHAIRELRVLKKRLETLSGGEGKKPTAKAAAVESQGAVTGAQAFSEILDVSGVKLQGQALMLAITTQIQTLRVLAATKKPSSIAAALPHLRHDNSSSPSAFLLAAAREKGADVGKIARQMEAVVQCLLSLAPSPSSKDDPVAQEPRLSIPPTAALELQGLALDTRLQWWELVKHKGDVEKEIMLPLSSRIEQKLQKLKLRPSTRSKFPLAGIYQTLATLARESQQIPEAISWATKLREIANPEVESIAKTCAIAAQLLSFQLKVPQKYYQDDALLDEVVAGIQGPLRGDMTELDELLTNVCAARKVVISVLVNMMKSKGDSKVFQASPATKELLETLILQCPRFCLRWLGKPPGPKGSTKDYLRYEQRRQLLMQSLQQTLESAFLIIKTRLEEARMAWDLMDSILGDCITLFEYTGNLATTEFSTSYVKISHFYYMQYNFLRQTCKDPKDPAPLRALRRSVECVKDRPSAEKEKAQLILKLERLAELARRLGRGEESLGAFQSIRSSLLEDGVLEAIANSLATESPVTVWARDEKAQSLSNALLSIAKKEQVWVDWTVDLSEPEQAAALEHRLRFILLAGVAKSTEITLEHPVVDTLLRVYIPTRYPVRRLRVLLCLLCSALGKLDRSSELWTVAKDAAQLEADGDLGEDSGLSSYIQHLKALYGTLSGALDGYPQDSLQQSVSAWQSIVKSCADRTELEKSIDDIPGLLDYLQSVADFLRMKGRDQMLASVLELMASVSQVAQGPRIEDIVENNALLAVQYTSLGQSSKARELFAKAQEHLASDVGGDTLATFHLAFAEYFVTLGEIKSAEIHLSEASVAYNPDPSLQRYNRLQKKLLVSNACYLYSVLALERGDSHHALVYARESVRAIFMEWTKLEAQLKAKTATPQPQPEDETINMSTADITVDSETPGAGPEFWKLFYSLFRNVLRLSSIYAHLGMFQETMYYAEQAMKIAKIVGSEFYNSQCAAWIGSVSWKAANASKSLEMLQEATSFLQDDDRSYLAATLACQLSSMYAAQNNMEGAERLLAKAETIAGNLAAPEVAVGEKKMEELKIEEKPARGGRKTVARKAPVKKTAAVSKTTKAKAAATPEPAEVVPEDAQLARLRANILIQKAASMLTQKEWAAAQATLSASTVASRAPDLVSTRKLAMASALLGMSMEQMAQDPVFSVIQDSTISFPALSGGERAASLSMSPVKGSSPRKRAVLKPEAREVVSGVYVQNLREAYDYLIDAHSAAATSGDSSLVHKISGMLQHVGLFLTATSARTRAITHSVQTSYSVELARNLTWRRERKAVTQEKKASKNDGTEWPALSQAAKSLRTSLWTTLDLHKFQKEYIDIVPKSWSVISISLSEGNHDLCITKLQAGQNPFVIRLPLERASSRDADSDVFNFQQGRSELVEIIKQINETCHSAKDVGAQTSKTTWWANREALDQRLKELLENIEQIWLGGFRGIFSQHVRHPDLLAQFQKAFLTMMDKHLPSRRQVRGKKTKSAAAQGPKVTLDMNILELFIGLGDATQQNCDFDDELTDLLYFVVDILQFHGERNAYDEIDFDSMVVETFDALQAYHSAVNSSCGTSEGMHTILLLDKALHVFPWESLPCMQGLAISRMPSLACLQRLIKERKRQAEAKEEGHHAAFGSGAYMLNPSGDLATTQSHFSGPLDTNLGPGWKKIVGRTPTEEEFESALSESDILLYFGHGSGAQYIRGRTIRRLDRCNATVLLMGCSSAALVEAGEFEPSGPAWNYLMAGCPAVVGTLWDVTDRDIDRFAGRCFEDLVEAVAVAREEACRFRFVTAAAVAVYGIPVFVDRD